MLVNLGDVWVDPTKVVSIRDTKNMAESDPLYTGQITVRISLTNGLVLPTLLPIEGGIDSFAAIINNAVGQSYGGQDEEETAET